DPLAVTRVIPIEAVEREQPARVGLARVVEAMPIDHRLAAEQQAKLVRVLQLDVLERRVRLGPPQHLRNTKGADAVEHRSVISDRWISGRLSHGAGRPSGLQVTLVSRVTV